MSVMLVQATGQCNRVLPLLDFMAFLRCEDATLLEPRLIFTSNDLITSSYIDMLDI